MPVLITYVYFFDDVISSDVSWSQRDEEARVLVQIFDYKEILKHKTVPVDALLHTTVGGGFTVVST